MVVVVVVVTTIVCVAEIWPTTACGLTMSSRGAAISSRSLLSDIADWAKVDGDDDVVEEGGNDESCRNRARDLGFVVARDSRAGGSILVDGVNRGRSGTRS